jgi:hypothetical protein
MPERISDSGHGVGSSGFPAIHALTYAGGAGPIMAEEDIVEHELRSNRSGSRAASRRRTSSSTPQRRSAGADGIAEIALRQPRVL